MTDKPSSFNRLPILQEPGLGRFPKWLHRTLPKGGQVFKTEKLLKEYRLNTVCEEAQCPNRFECYTKKTATFLILGKSCTRACGFCDIDFDKNPKAPESDEPIRIAQSVKELGLSHVVITMVARDDLPDGGASHLKNVVQQTQALNPDCTIEVLTSDFEGNKAALDLIISEKPLVFNHNLETVRELTPKVRHRATYDRSLEVLRYVKQSNQIGLIKSGLMVGLGETKEQMQQALNDLQAAGVDIVTIGHYLQASSKKISVKSFVPPEDFDFYRDYGHKIGLKYVYAGPFIRSSYNADLFAQYATQGKNS